MLWFKDVIKEIEKEQERFSYVWPADSWQLCGFPKTYTLEEAFDRVRDELNEERKNRQMLERKVNKILEHLDLCCEYNPADYEIKPCPREEEDGD